MMVNGVSLSCEWVGIVGSMQQSPFLQSKLNAAPESAPNSYASQKSFSVIPSVRPATPILDTINAPVDLKRLSVAELITLTDELREYLLYSAGVSGGHFGANLGVIELTVALHYLLNAPDDQIVWDVGHQAYAHKILTGRREQIGSIRAKGGLTAFPERAESIFDTFGVGHSSTAISAGLGMSLALRYQNRPQTVACIIGDGAMTGGMAFEAMNDAVQQDADLLVILNDNDMSISCSIGGFSRHLASLWESGYQVDIDDHGQPDIKLRPEMQGFERRGRHGKARPIPKIEDNLFKAIGFAYFGPFDGHDIPELLRVLSRAKQVSGPVLVHVYTTKGKGFLPAEADPVGYHAIGKLADTSSSAPKSAPKLKFSDVFGQFLCDKAEQDDKLLAITPAMEEGSGMTEFARKFPERFFDVAIAEQHAVTVAGGMATQGAKPIVAIYSTFLQRGYDQLIHDIALQNLDVMFAIDRAGLVGEDGATHAGVFDFAFLRCVPNMIIAAPKDENECYQLLNTCYDYKGCTAVRYPRGSGIGAIIQKPAQYLEVGKAEIEAVLGHDRAKTKLAILVFGTMVATAQTAAQNLFNEKTVDDNDLQIYLVNMRWVKPLDSTLIEELLTKDITHVATVEEHVIMGGAGSAVNEYLINDSALFAKNKPLVKNLGIPDHFIPHGSQSEQRAASGLDVLGIEASLKQLLA